MSDIIEAQRSLERHLTHTNAPHASVAALRDPAATLSEACAGILDIIEKHDGSATPGDQKNANIACARYFQVKSVCDRLITALLMVVALPLMAVVSVAILLLDGRPVFYRQTRVGRHGRKFQIWKFRTMCQNAESGTGAVWSSDSDPRVTRLGRWLRCSHLDELPQFLNILAGEMNLIGPRPERPEFVERLQQEIPRYAERHNVRPGLTGLAQLRLGYDQTVAGVGEKVLIDLEYIQTTNAVMDARILAATLPYIAKNLLKKKREKLTAAQDAPEGGAGKAAERTTGSRTEGPHRRVSESAVGTKKNAAQQAPAA